MEHVFPPATSWESLWSLGIHVAGNTTAICITGPDICILRHYSTVQTVSLLDADCFIIFWCRLFHYILVQTVSLYFGADCFFVVQTGFCCADFFHFGAYCCLWCRLFYLMKTGSFWCRLVHYLIDADWFILQLVQVVSVWCRLFHYFGADCFLWCRLVFCSSYCFNSLLGAGCFIILVQTASLFWCRLLHFCADCCIFVQTILLFYVDCCINWLISLPGTATQWEGVIEWWS